VFFPLLRAMALPLVLVAAWPAHAELLPELTEAQPLREYWANAGMYSRHFQREKGLSDSNPGLGIEYRYSSTSSLIAGRFYNSDRQYSNYGGMVYQPLAVAGVRLGAALAAFDGYPRMRNGGAFLALVPVASLEWQRFGLNICYVPSYKDRLYGAVSLQLKLRVFD